MAGAEIVVERGEHAVLESDLDEAVAGGLAHLGREVRLLDREHVDAGGGAGPRFGDLADVHHRELPLSTHRAQVGNGQTGPGS